MHSCYNSLYNTGKWNRTSVCKCWLVGFYYGHSYINAMPIYVHTHIIWIKFDQHMLNLVPL